MASFALSAIGRPEHIVMLPPKSALDACLTVLSRACIDARLLGWSGEKDGPSAADASELADLMDAIHNLPHLIQNWEHCDEQLLRAMLTDFDRRHRNGKGIPLLEVYERRRGDAG